MTCVYCEPKSRMRILECADGVDMCALKVARRGRASARAHVRVTGAVDIRLHLPFASYSAAELFLELFAGGPFARATPKRERGRESERGKESYHPATVELRGFIARKCLWRPSGCAARGSPGCAGTS